MNKYITVWINSRWVAEGYTEQVDTGMTIDEWNNLLNYEREEIAQELTQEILWNMVESGWYEE